MRLSIAVHSVVMGKHIKSKTSRFSGHSYQILSFCRYVTIIKATIYYFLPLTIIGILYTLMANKLQKSAQEVQNIASCHLKDKNPQAQNRRHVARMVIVFILGLLGVKENCIKKENSNSFSSFLPSISTEVFIICFLPHWIFQLWFWISADAEANYNLTWHYVRIIGFCL
jgi:bombesin receptor subtype-3